MFINDIVMNGPDDHASIEPLSHQWKVFTDLNSGNSRINCGIGGAGLPAALSWIADDFGIPRINLAGPTTEPDKNAASGLSQTPAVGQRGVSTEYGRKRGRGGGRTCQESSSINAVVCHSELVS